MPVYWLALVNVTDPEVFVEYAKTAPAAVHKYDGKVITAGRSIMDLEGEGAPSAYAIIEFPTVERAVECYNSPEYQDAKSRREGAADFKMVMLKGV